MSRNKKFNFDKILMEAPVEEKQTLSLFKNGQMVLSKSLNHKYGLNGKLVDFRYDPAKRALGFTVIKGSLPENSWSKTMRVLKEWKDGQIRIGVGKILKRVGLDKKNVSGLMVNEYQDLMEDREILYVIIPKHKDNGAGNK